MCRLMREKGGLVYILRKSIRGTYHIRRMVGKYRIAGWRREGITRRPEWIAGNIVLFESAIMRLKARDVFDLHYIMKKYELVEKLIRAV